MSSDDHDHTERPLQEDQVEAFARQVLRTLNKHKAMPVSPQPHQVRLQEATDWLLKTVLEARDFDAARTASRFDRFGVSLPEIIDGCILQSARRAGQMWVDDTASFAQVSLVGARLYALCKFLNEEWKPRSASKRGPSLLVLTAPGDQHMLGAVVLTSQLRRRGCSVHLMTGNSPKDAVRRAQNHSFEAILISCSSIQTLDNVNRFIARIHAHIEKPPRIVVGGAVANDTNLEEVTGADLVTSRIDIALAGLIGSEKDVDLLAAQ